MPLKKYKCSICGEVTQTLKRKVPSHCEQEMELLIEAPATASLETVDKFTNKKRLKNQQKILKERARNYSRDQELDDLIQTSKSHELTASQFLNKSGKKRNKFDDI